MKKVISYSFILCLLSTILSCTSLHNEVDYKIVPLPNNIVEQSNGDFTLDNRVSIVVATEDTVLTNYANDFISFIKLQTGIELSIANADSNAIIIEIEDISKNEEAYSVDVSSDKILIKATTHKGAFYAFNLLKKSIIPVLTESKTLSSIVFPSVTITDEPTFAYRGMMLDVSRHFSTVDEVKKVLDILAWHNINIFHWHLSDDQGWRIEIKKYPELSEISAWRDATIVGRPNGTENYPVDGKRHGGFYTQEEIKDIIAYAADRNIEVIPEIDMPGHNQAVLAAYPNLGCTGGPYKVCDRWGVIKEVLCVGNPESLEFYKNVFSEVIDLFPSKYIHIGGDECVKDRWKKCPKCQSKIKALGLKSEGDFTKEDLLQSHFMSEIADLIHSRGKEVIGWDEILEGKPVENSVVMSWRGTQGGIEAAKKHHNVIMSPATHLYFDYSQTLNTSKEEIPVGGFINVERVYNYEPYPSELTAEECKYIIGVQANLWAEYMPSEKTRHYQMLPRLAALSEVQWRKPGTKDYSLFLERLPNMIKLYDLYNYNYAKHIFNVSISDTPIINKGWK